MKKTAQKHIRLISFTIALLLVSAGYSFGQELIRTFTITPPVVQRELEPGKTTEGVMRVVNDSEQSLTFTATVSDFIVEDSKGTPKILPDNTLSKKYSAASWIGVTPSSFTVEPHKRAEVNYYIQVPKDARPGGHYAIVVFKPVSFIPVEGTGTDVNTQIGSLFYLDVKGDIHQEASITKFLGKLFNEYGPVTLNTQVKNLGDLHIRPQGKITVKNVFGRTVDTKDLQENNIFPEAVRDYENDLGKKWMFGPYKAQLLASYGRGDNLPLVATYTFWVIPWKIVLLVILLAVAVFLALKYKNKRSHKEEVKPQEESVS